ncbi:Fur family transcriptional regulator [Nonomuraea angiospora]
MRRAEAGQGERDGQGLHENHGGNARNAGSAGPCGRPYDQLRKTRRHLTERRLGGCHEHGPNGAHVFEDHGETTYRLCGPNHHHHLVCQSCGTVIEGPPVPEPGRWLRRLDTEHGFQAERHRFEVYGTCSTCRLAGEPGKIAPPTR